MPERVRPKNLAEASRAMSGGRARGGPRVLLEGRGSKLDWGRSPEAVDRVVETGGLVGFVEHDPADMTATLWAGTRLAVVQETLAPHGQWLAVDPPHPEATVGGIFATGDFGPRRQAYGTLRDLVIGATFVLSDGTVARSGSKVIKNVAGFDLCKLLAGSLGTLGLVAQVTVRLHPVTPCRTVRVVCDGDEATRLGLALAASAREPVAMDHDGEGLLVRFEGPAARLDADVAYLRGQASCEVVDEAVWARHRRALAGEEGDLVVRLGALPSQGHAVTEAVADAAAGWSKRHLRHVGLGLHRLVVPGGSAEERGRLLQRLRDAMERLGGYAVAQRGASALSVDPFGAEPSAIDVMRRVKVALDPDRRCAPGRFVGGI